MQRTIINYLSIDKSKYYAQLEKTNRSSKKKINKSSREKTMISNAKTY